MDDSGVAWRKSSRSGNPTSGDCVEVACLPLAMAVRDSKNPAAGVLAIPAGPWRAFLTSIR
ncbi:MAG: DUF397 domain-containing protein [Kibdelosporangium sp.]